MLLDIWMPDVDGITLLKEWGATGQLNMPVIMMSGHGTIDTAVEATKYGAIAFLEKPITLQKLLRAVEQALIRAPARPRTLAGRQRPLAGVPGQRGEPDLTVEAAMTGGLGLPTMPVDLGPQSEQSFDLDRPLREARDAFEKSYFEFHLARENGSMTRVAEKTGLERTHLYRKLKQLGVDLSRNKRGAGLKSETLSAGAILAGFVGLVAQLVEQRIENPRVGGSIPPQATKIKLSATSTWRSR